MKITDPQVIKDGEQDLIEAVLEDLDQDAVRTILQERMARAALSPKGGQIVVHDNEIAFRLDFQLNLSGSLLFDREGNYIAQSGDPDPLAEPGPDASAPLVSEPQTPEPASGGAPQEMDLQGAPEQNRDEIILDDHFDEADMDMGVLPPKTAKLFDTKDDAQDAVDLADDLLEEEDLDLGPSQPDSRQSDPEPLDQVDLEEDAEDDLLTDDLTIDLPDYDSSDDDPPEEPDPDLNADAPQELETTLDAKDSVSLDDDINEILQESREFWEKNKEA